MASVDIEVAGSLFKNVGAPDGCTVAKWKELLGQGKISKDKILYANKLIVSSRKAKGDKLDESALLPRPPDDVLLVSGPASIINMLQLSLRKDWTPSASTILETISQEKAAATPGLIHSWGGQDPHMCFHCNQCLGSRDYQEDRMLAMLSLPKAPNIALFGVFDGHGGDAVADLCIRTLPGVLEKTCTADVHAEDLSRAFMALDTDLKRMVNNPMVGSTANILLVIRGDDGSRLLCANLGDSRAVLCRGGRALELSRDHKPELEEESSRIQNAGGRVTMGRINDGLNLSRSFGDFGYKARNDMPAEQQMVIALPDVAEVKLQQDDSFVVMASDGIFDAYSSEDLVASIGRSLEKNMSLEAVTENILQEANGGDNASLCLCLFRQHSGTKRAT